MNKRKGVDKGITLIALIITIIVILILAGVSISMLFGDNGILDKADKSAETTKIKGYEEKIRLSITEGKSDDIIDPEKYSNKRELLVGIGDIILKDSQFETAQICKSEKEAEDIKLVVRTKDGYVFDVYVDKTEYAGTKEEVGDITLDIDLQIGDIIFTCEPNSWTNQIVNLTIETKEEYKEYEVEYSYDTVKWDPYTEKIKVENNNTTIYSRLRSGDAVLDGYSSVTITNIDKLAPNEFTPETKNTTNSIEVIVNAEDADATTTSGKSEISGYRFKLDSGEWTEYQTSGEYTWNDLIQNTEYTIMVEVRDRAGNVRRLTKKEETDKVPEASNSNLNYQVTWIGTNAKVDFTTDSDFKIELSLDKVIWNITDTITVPSNTTIYARLTDEKNVSSNFISVFPEWTGTVTYDANGGSGAPKSQIKQYGKTLVLSSTEPTKTNSVFLGWTTTNGSETVNYAAGANYTTDSSVILYAVWHTHVDSCYSTACTGSFTETKSNETYYTDSHTHTGNSTSGGGCYKSANTSYTTCGGTISKHENSETVSCSKTQTCTGNITLNVTRTTTGTCSHGYEYTSSSGILQCNKCGRYPAGCATNSTTSCPVRGCEKSTADTGRCGATVTCTTCNGTGYRTSYYTSYTCNRCGKSYSSTGTCTAQKSTTTYSINCGKNVGTQSFSRTITTYSCSTCGKSFVYKPAANRSCSICGGSHSVSASGSTTGTHNAITKYLNCKYK